MGVIRTQERCSPCLLARVIPTGHSLLYHTTLGKLSNFPKRRRKGSTNCVEDCKRSSNPTCPPSTTVLKTACAAPSPPLIIAAPTRPRLRGDCLLIGEDVLYQTRTKRTLMADERCGWGQWGFLAEGSRRRCHCREVDPSRRSAMESKGPTGVTWATCPCLAWGPPLHPQSR